MNRFKQLLFICILITVLSTAICVIINWWDTVQINWTYLLYNEKLYVLNTPKTLEPSELNNLTKVDKVEKEIPRFFKPKSNNVSNAIPKGTDIYIENGITETYTIVIKFKDKYYRLVNTDNADGWGNGIMVRLH